MRQISRVDANQRAITLMLRAAGWSVQPLHQLGRGAPDLLCGKHGINVLLELKDGTRPPSERKLTPAERAFFRNWKGQVEIANSPEEALQICESTVAELRDWGDAPPTQ